MNFQMKRGAGSPPTLAAGEPSFDTTNKRFYVGDGTNNYLLARAWTVTAVKTATYTAALWELVRCDPSGGGFTVNLPTAVGRTGEEIAVKNVTTSTNTITLDGAGTETIEGSTTLAMTTARGVTRLVSDGANWMSV